MGSRDGEIWSSFTVVQTWGMGWFGVEWWQSKWKEAKGLNNWPCQLLRTVSAHFLRKPTLVPSALLHWVSHLNVVTALLTIIIKLLIVWFKFSPTFLDCSLRTGQCFFLAVSLLRKEAFRVKTFLILRWCYLPFQLILTSVQGLYNVWWPHWY